MTAWLHDDDILRTLADESGPAGHWAQLQRLLRGTGTVVPTSEHFVGPAVVVGGQTLWDRVAWRDAPQVLPWLDAWGRVFGGLPATLGERQVQALRDALSGPHGQAAADLLVAGGRFEGSMLGGLVERFPQASTLGAWVLAASDDPEAVAGELVGHLVRTSPNGGLTALRDCCDLLLGISSQGPAGVEGLLRGARIGGLLELPAMPKGAQRRRAWKLAVSWSERLPPTMAALVRAFAAHPDVPELPGDVAMVLGIHSHGEGWDTGRTDLAALREGRRRSAAGEPVQARVSAQALVLAAEKREWFDDPGQPGEWMLQASAVGLHVEQWIGWLDDPELCAHALSLARFAPVEPVLERLLELPVPADAVARGALGLALAHMGTPQVVERLRGLLPLLERGSQRLVVEHTQAILGVNLA